MSVLSGWQLCQLLLHNHGWSTKKPKVFSIAGLTITKTRSQLDPDAVDQIIFMNKVLQRKYQEEKKAVQDGQELQIKQEPKDEQSQPKIKQERENEFGDKDDDLPLPKLYWNFEEQGGERGTLNGDRGAEIMPREDPNFFISRARHCFYKKDDLCTE